MQGTPSFYRPVESPAEAQWYVEALRCGRWTVGLFVPAGFEAYVRIPHPKWKTVPEGTFGAIFYHECWRRPVAFDVEGEAYDADEGQLIGPWADVLFSTLADVSAKSDVPCVCGLWEGYGGEGGDLQQRDSRSI